MLSLDRLPNEVLHGIASFLHKKYDLAALSRVNHHCYEIASPILWKREKKSDRPGAIHWAVEHEDTNVLKKALDAGVNPSRLAYLHKPKPRIDPRYKWWNYHSSYYDDPAWSMDDDDASVDLDASFVFHDHCTCFEGDGCCDAGVYEDCSWEPLHIAAAKGRIDMIEKLLDKGANIDAGSWGYCLCQPHLPVEAFSATRVGFRDLEDLHGSGWTPLHVAICNSQVEAAKFLLKRGASTTVYHLGLDVAIVPLNPNDEGLMPDPADFKLTALHNAATYDQPELVQFILDEKYQDNVEIEAPYMGTPLIQAIWYGYWDTVVPCLLKYGANIDARLAETRLTSLMMACFSRRFDDAAKLVDCGASVTALSVHHLSILHLVLGPSQLDEDDYYLDDDFDRPPSKKNTVTDADLIRKFIEKGFPVDTPESLLGMTPLMLASSSCNIDAMKALLEGGAKVNALDHDGLTALARVGEGADGPEVAHLLEAGRLLLDNGATLNDSREELTVLNIICSRQNEERYTTKEWADQHAKLAQLFIERGADPNDKGVSPSRPFTEAVQYGNFTLAQVLLDNGGRPEPNDVIDMLRKSTKDPYDEGKTEFLVNLDFEKYEMKRPCDTALLGLAKIALSSRLWSRVADIIRVVPCPKDLLSGLMHRSLMEGTRNEEDPSSLVLALIELGEDPNELYQGEPAIYYSLKSAYCWRSTPMLVNAGADVRMATPNMKDGAFMHAVKQGYQGQVVQILAKHPDILKDKPDELHQQCWESVICHGTHSRPGSSRRGEPLNLPYLHWNTAKKLLEAGLKTDVDLPDGSSVKHAVELATPAIRSLGKVEREVLSYFGYETSEDLEALREIQNEFEPLWDSDLYSPEDLDDYEDSEVYDEGWGDDDDEMEDENRWPDWLSEDEDGEEDSFDEDDDSDDDGGFPMPPMSLVLGLLM